MTAAQNSIALKGSRSYVGMFAAVAMGLILVIVVVALSARPLAAPTTLNQSTPLTLGHDEGRFTAPILTSGHDEARPSHVQVQLPTVPLAPRGGGSNRAQ